LKLLLRVAEFDSVVNICKKSQGVDFSYPPNLIPLKGSAECNEGLDIEKYRLIR
jgi:hypothetical protein